MGQNFPAQMAMLEKSGQYAQMLVATQHLSKVAPRDAQAPLYAGRAHFWRGQFDEARAQWKQAVALNPSLGSQISPLQAQMTRIQNAHPGLHLQPLEVVPSEVQSAKAALESQADALLKGHRFAELDQKSEQLEHAQTGAVAALDGASASWVFNTALAQPDSDSIPSWEQRRGWLEAWIKARPASRWAKLALFHAWTERAWALRGGEYAAKVSPQQWQNMGRALAQAALVGKALPPSAQESPLFWNYTMEFSVLAGAPLEQIRAMHERAAQKFPNDRTPDFAFAFALLPQWRGAQGEWQQFITERADAIGGQEGDIAYLQMAMKQAGFLDQKTLWKRQGISWPRARRGALALLQRHPQLVALPTWILFNALNSEDIPTARAMMLRLGSRIGNEPDQTAHSMSRLRLALLDPASKPEDLRF